MSVIFEYHSRTIKRTVLVLGVDMGHLILLWLPWLRQCLYLLLHRLTILLGDHRVELLLLCMASWVSLLILSFTLFNTCHSLLILTELYSAFQIFLKKGTFHSTLYQSPLPGNEGNSSVISIAPTTFSVGMFSWFPVYFPLREPLHVPTGSTVICTMWRKMDRSDDGGGRVWYEWCAEIVGKDDDVISASHLHNPGGRSYHVRL
mmetsp:Transcript_4030/g.5121  ORF Transcript_4030/g.5121 Transcript_4030/m.5121 type:complete len:204 (+) Transcript_4030:2035-2646(+)